jgi:hypothetical protein
MEGGAKLMDTFLWIATIDWRAKTHFIKKLSTGQRKGCDDEKSNLRKRGDKNHGSQEKFEII